VDIPVCPDCANETAGCLRCREEQRARLEAAIRERLEQHMLARPLTYTIDRSQPIFEATVIIGRVELEP
jgi:hypothetical protein